MKTHFNMTFSVRFMIQNCKSECKHAWIKGAIETKYDIGIVMKLHELLSNNKILSFFACCPLDSFLEQEHSAHTECWFHLLRHHPVLALHTPLLAFKSMEIGTTGGDRGRVYLRVLLLPGVYAGNYQLPCAKNYRVIFCFKVLLWEEGQFISLRLLLLRTTRARGRSWLLNTVFVAHDSSLLRFLKFFTE